MALTVTKTETVTTTVEHSTGEMRLLLYDKLTELGPEHFNMAWWYTNCGPILELEQVLSGLEMPDLQACGTAACAAGAGAVVMRELGHTIDPCGDVPSLPSLIGDVFGLHRDYFFVNHWPAEMRSRLLDEIYHCRGIAPHDTSAAIRRAEWTIFRQLLSSLLRDGEPPTGWNI